MSDNDNGLHERAAAMSALTLDMHRALSSLQEELEAVDWYNQRIDVVGDDRLKAILVHNMNEEKEHAAMVLEWLRRNDAEFDHHLRDYLFTEGDLVAREEAAGDEAGGETAPARDVAPPSIGAMKEEK